MNLDANAGIPARPSARRAYQEAAANFANPSSPHALGHAAAACLHRARVDIAAALGAQADDVVLTSGGTEADALAILGVVQAGDHVVTSGVEHPAVTQTLAALTDVEVTTIAAGRDGRVDTRAFIRAVRGDTRLVSLVAACNETGVRQGIAEVAAALRDHGALVHTDAVQAIGRGPVSMRDWHVDLLSVSGHKVGAVDGIGALLVRDGVSLRPVLVGGGQERGRRAATENVAGAASLGAALRDLADENELAALQALRDELESALTQLASDLEIVGQGMPRLPNTSCFRVPGCEGDALMMALDVRDVCISTGSACSSGSVEPSPILLAMGMTEREAKECVRISLPRDTTAADISTAVGEIAAVLKQVRPG